MAVVDSHWRAEFLVGRGRNVVALDCRGNGRSGKPRMTRRLGDREPRSQGVRRDVNAGVA